MNLSMCIYIYTCVCVYAYIYIYTYLCACVCVCVFEKTQWLKAPKNILDVEINKNQTQKLVWHIDIEPPPRSRPRPAPSPRLSRDQSTSSFCSRQGSSRQMLPTCNSAPCCCQGKLCRFLTLDAKKKKCKSMVHGPWILAEPIWLE